MKINPAFLALMTLSLLASGWAVERTTTLQVETRLYGATGLREAAPAEPPALPDIVVFARLFKPGLGRDAAAEEQALKRFFNLPALTLQEEARTGEMTWSEDNETKKGRLTVGRRIRLSGGDFIVVLVPEEVRGPGQASLIRLEIHRAAAGQGGSIDVLEKVVAKDISWDYEGPLIVGFFFPGETYFLSLEVQARKSAYGGRLASSISWTL